MIIYEASPSWSILAGGSSDTTRPWSPGLQTTDPPTLDDTQNTDPQAAVEYRAAPDTVESSYSWMEKIPKYLQLGDEAGKTTNILMWLYSVHAGIFSILLLTCVEGSSHEMVFFGQ